MVFILRPLRRRVLSAGTCGCRRPLRRSATSPRSKLRTETRSAVPPQRNKRAELPEGGREGEREEEWGERRTEKEKGHSVCGPPFVSILPRSSSSSAPLGDKKPSGRAQKRRHGAVPGGSSPRQKYLGVLSSSLSVPLSLACGGLLPECPAAVTNIFTCAVTLENYQPVNFLLPDIRGPKKTPSLSHPTHTPPPLHNRPTVVPSPYRVGELL